MQRLKGFDFGDDLNVVPRRQPALHVRGGSDHFEVPTSMYDQVFDAPIIHRRNRAAENLLARQLTLIRKQEGGRT